MAFRSGEPIRTKITTNCQITKQVIHLKYSGNCIHHDKNIDGQVRKIQDDTWKNQSNFFKKKKSTSSDKIQVVQRLWRSVPAVTFGYNCTHHMGNKKV